jgi:hypothetical protein
MTYQRTGRMASPQAETEAQNPAIAAGGAPGVEPGSVRINGFSQVVEMLKAADDQFRHSLLKRLSAQNPQLGQQLRQALRDAGL